jgi:hypothetical protein
VVVAASPADGVNAIGDRPPAARTPVVVPWNVKVVAFGPAQLKDRL